VSARHFWCGQITDAAQNAHGIGDGIEAEKPNGSVLRPQQAKHVLDQGGFARAIFTHESEYYPFWDIQRHVV
jgi:hypothetical protein